MRIRTGYSFRSAFGMLDTVIGRLHDMKWMAAPISDRASTFGFVKWTKLAKKHGMRPIYGLELAVTESINAKKPIIDYWTFFAKDSLVPLNKLLALATAQFRYYPVITYEQAMAADGLVKIVGSHSMLDNIYPSTSDLYVALSPSASTGYINKAKEMQLKLIASSDNAFVNEGDRPVYEIICGRNASNQIYSQHILSWDEWKKELAWKFTPSQIKEALTLLEVVSKQCVATLPKAQIYKPKRKKTLLKMCQEGAKKLGVDLSNKDYAARLKRELDLIASKNFEDYFYIIADVVQWARQRMIVGPARGSSCGSLACYLLQITTVDPLQYGLIFERFIDINRNDLPDIDIDFSDSKRHLVFEYMNEKYGSEHVARLGTVALYRPRSALQEAGAALHIPRWKCDAVAESLIERSSGDSRALQTLEDTLAETQAGKTLLRDHPEIKVITKMEGHPRHNSQHAAGIILTQEPVDNYVSVDMRTNATHCDKKDAEGLGLLKIDALGLTQLSVFEDALAMAGLDMHHLESVPRDDKAAFEVLNKRQYAGIFQFNGLALQGITNQIKVTSIDDIINITALARPGPLSTGGASRWVQRKNGTESVSYPHAVFKPYMEDTLGVVVYQEQVMEIGRNIGDLSWEDVTALRKAMSQSLGKEFFDKFGDRWKAGAQKKGVPAADTIKIWDDLCAYGAWAFNKSHSVAYGIISYWCCWLKAHHPVEFAAATLSHQDDVAEQIKLLRELDKEGVSYVPVDKDRSVDQWTAHQGKLVGPLSSVSGIGPKMVQTILSARARGEKLPDRALKLLTNPKTTIDSLWPVRDEFKRIMPDPHERQIYTEPTLIEDITPEKDQMNVLVFCTFQKINPRDENEAVKVAKRGNRITDGFTTSLNLTLRDDTGTIFGKVNRFNFEKIGKAIVDRGGPDKALYAVKGVVSANEGFKMVRIRQVRYIGTIGE